MSNVGATNNPPFTRLHNPQPLQVTRGDHPENPDVQSPAPDANTHEARPHPAKPSGGNSDADASGSNTEGGSPDSTSGGPRHPGHPGEEEGSGHQRSSLNGQPRPGGDNVGGPKNDQVTSGHTWSNGGASGPGQEGRPNGQGARYDTGGYSGGNPPNGANANQSNGLLGGLLGAASRVTGSLFGDSSPSNFNLGNGNNGHGSASHSFAGNLFSSTVPRFIGDTARLIDPAPQQRGNNDAFHDENRPTSGNSVPQRDSGAESDRSSNRTPASTIPRDQLVDGGKGERAVGQSGLAAGRDGETQTVINAPVVAQGLLGKEGLELLPSTLLGAPADGDTAVTEDGEAQAKTAAANLTAEELALLGKAMADAATGKLATARDATTPQQAQGGAPTDADGADPRSAPNSADGKRANEMLDRALAKMPGDTQTQRVAQEARIIDPRLDAQNQARSEIDARMARDAAGDKGRLGNFAEAGRNGIGENARRALNEAANGGERRYGAAESMRQALDWVGQQIRGTRFEDADSHSEGVHAMRVVAGLIVAGVTVGVAIGVLYALELIFAG